MIIKIYKSDCCKATVLLKTEHASDKTLRSSHPSKYDKYYCSKCKQSLTKRGKLIKK